MVTWISNWVGGIVVAVIVATIIEMLLPEGNNKKYIKSVIGVFILFTILAPVISVITKQDFNMEENINKWGSYLANAESKVETGSLQEVNNRTIEEIYLDKMKEDITSKIRAKGYEVNSLEVEAKLDPNGEEDYGKIMKIKAWIARKQDEKEEVEQPEQDRKQNKVVEINTKENGKIDTSIQVEKIETEDGLEQPEQASQNVTIFEINDMKKHLNSTYEVPIPKIKINEN